MLKKCFKNISLLSLMVTVFTVPTVKANNFDQILSNLTFKDSYLSYEGQVRYQRFKDGYGDKFLNGSYVQGRVSYGGYILDDYSIEFGVFASESKSSTKSIANAKLILGEPSLAYKETHEASFNIKGTDFFLNKHFFPSHKFLKDTKFIASLGVVAIKPSGTHKFIEFQPLPNTPVTSVNSPEEELKTSWSFIPVVGVGAERKLYEKITLRLRLDFELTSLTKKLVDNNPDMFNYTAKPKDSLLFSIGLVCRI